MSFISFGSELKLGVRPGFKRLVVLPYQRSTVVTLSPHGNGLCGLHILHAPYSALFSVPTELLTTTMAIRADTTPRNLTHGEVAIREFTNTNLTPELSRRQAALLLNCKELLRNIRGLTPEDQMKFVEKVDQVC